MSLHRFGDLILDSQIPLPALPHSAHDRADLRFGLRSGAPRAARWDHHWRYPDGSVSLSCGRDARGYRLGFPGLATFEIARDGLEIDCLPERALSLHTIEHLLIDQVLPRVLTHRGRLVLHAGAVVLDGGAVLFLGGSGAGKSTLCASLARAGAALLGDDGVWLRRGIGGGFDAEATYPGLRLRPDPLSRHFGDPSAFARVSEETDKRRVPAAEAPCGSLPLRRLYVLESACGNDVRVEPLRGAAAFIALVSAAFQLHLDDPARTGEMFEQLGAVLSAVEIRTLVYPRDYDRLPEVREAIVGDLAA